MTIDERIAKLAERHEALTQSVEILTTDDLSKLQCLVSQLAEGTARLLHVTEIHERRITRLEETNS
jgi:hypothetical protein